MKKSVSLLLAALMLTGALAGCGSSASGTQAADGADSGVSGAITVISREDGSGTRGAFIELTGVEEKTADGKKVDNTTADAEIANKTDVVLTSVAGNEKAIGYISLGALNDTVKAVKVDGAEATVDNVKAGAYKLSRSISRPRASRPASPRISSTSFSPRKARPLSPTTSTSQSMMQQSPSYPTAPPARSQSAAPPLFLRSWRS